MDYADYLIIRLILAKNWLKRQIIAKLVRYYKLGKINDNEQVTN